MLNVNAVQCINSYTAPFWKLEVELIAYDERCDGTVSPGGGVTTGGTPYTFRNTTPARSG